MSRKPQFDLKTHVRNSKGQVMTKNLYRLVIENGVYTYERPPGSGYFYDSAGTLLKSPKAEKQEQVQEQTQDLDSKIEELEVKQDKPKFQPTFKSQVK